MQPVDDDERITHNEKTTVPLDDWTIVLEKVLTMARAEVENLGDDLQSLAFVATGWHDGQLTIRSAALGMPPFVIAGYLRALLAAGDGEVDAMGQAVIRMFYDSVTDTIAKHMAGEDDDGV